MDNIFKDFQVGTRFDLKGSIAGRTRLKGDMTIEDPQRDITVALKDNDFRYNIANISIQRGLCQNSRNIHEILQSDADFLRNCKIIDYSLLLGEILLDDEPSESQLIASTDEVVKQNNKLTMNQLQEVLSENPELARGLYETKDNKLYLLGIIDPLTGFTTAKNLEYNFKWIKHGHNMSCVPPDIYADRFTKFMKEIFMIYQAPEKVENPN